MNKYLEKIADLIVHETKEGKQKAIVVPNDHKWDGSMGKLITRYRSDENGKFTHVAGKQFRLS